LTTPHIRAARPDEADALSDLMRRSKAYWGYDADFMARIVSEMQISADQITEALTFCVGEDDFRRVVGFYHLHVRKIGLRLEDLFIEPDCIGQGYGKRLWDHAVESARVYGFDSFTLEADPHAEPFYLKMGAVRIGERESHIAGRFLPQMQYIFPEREHHDRQR
jgi:GNAT superfamily N-acetyltransferase